MAKLLTTLLILVAAYYFTHRALPWLFTAAGRALGFEMNPSPDWQKRMKRFRSLRRGYYSYLIITTLFVLSFFLEFLVNNKPLMIKYDGRVAFPAFAEWGGWLPFVKDSRHINRKSDFGQVGDDEVDYRLFAAEEKDPSLLDGQIAEREKEIKDTEAEIAATKPGPGSTEDEKLDYRDLQETVPDIEGEIAALKKAKAVFAAGKASIIMPLYPYSPYEHLMDMPGRPPTGPTRTNILGTDDSATDVFAQLVYGFRVSLSFALIVSVLGYIIGIVVGAVMGYFGGWVDILIQRFIEIWASIPFLYVIMIIASIVQPSFILLVIMLVALSSWLSMTYYIRGEFYREKSRDYVQAAVAMGAGDWSVMMKHILPNSLVPVVTFAPFAIVGYVGQLVSLDYLGFGLPVGTPSWGVLMDQGMQYIKYYPHLILTPSIALAVTLYLVVQIGEAVREAFDPKVFSRLR